MEVREGHEDTVVTPINYWTTFSTMRSSVSEKVGIKKFAFRLNCPDYFNNGYCLNNNYFKLPAFFIDIQQINVSQKVV